MLARSGLLWFGWIYFLILLQKGSKDSNWPEAEARNSINDAF
jgi:hypothetical protein